MTSVRSVHPEQYIPTDPGPVDPLNKILPAIGQVHPAWRQRHAMQHGRYLSGLGGLAGAGPIAQKTRDGQFEVGGSCDFLTDGDEPDWSDPLLAENEHEDDSVGTGIFDQAGGATVHSDMGVFADHPAVPGYIARNPPFYVNPEVQDITADAQVLEVPGGGLNYLEHGGINVAPPISPYARYEPYVSYPCQSQFQPRQPNKWQAGPPPGSQPPLPMNTPPISANPPPQGSNIPVEQHHPTPPSHRYPSALGPVPHPWRAPATPSGRVPATPGGGRVPAVPGSMVPGGATVPGTGMPGGSSTTQSGGSPTTPPGAGLHGFGQSPSNIYNPQTYIPADTREVPGYPPRPCNPGRRHPYGQLVPFQRIVDPIDIAEPVSPWGGSAPCRPCAPRGMHGFGSDGIRTVSTVDPTGMSIPIGYGYFGDDPTVPTPTPTPTPAASSTGPGIMSYAMAGVVLGIGAYLFVGATSGKSKR